MKALVTGVKGQLGHDVMNELAKRGYEGVGVDVEEMDITDAAAVDSVIREAKVDSVVHCAAWTAVDAAEDNEEMCRKVNAEGTENIAKVCKALDIPMIYISTDYVFEGEGTRPWEPDDKVTQPLNIYGQTKYEGEQAVERLLDKYYIVRIAWVFGVNGKNFIKTMLRLADSRSEVRVVCDQIGSPTYTADLAPLLCDMTGTEKYGVYHATNEGVCSWAELAQEVFHRSGKAVHVEPILTAEYPTKAVRPLNSRLSKRALDEAGFSRLPCWQDALDRFLKELEGNKQTI